MVHFDLSDGRAGCVSHATLTQIGIQGTLRNKVGTEFFYFFLKHLFIHTTHRKPLLTHLKLPLKRCEKLVGGIRYLDLDPILPSEIFFDIRFIVRSIDAVDIYTFEFGTSLFEEVCHDR